MKVNSPPTQQHLRAVQRCVALAAATWTSTIETRIKIDYLAMERGDILGDARAATSWYVDGYTYTSAMAKSVLDEDINALGYGDDRYDILVRINTQASWYVGLDGNPGADQFDLVTVCLHELYHGLMISGGNIKVVQSANGTGNAYTATFFDNIDRRFDAFVACETNAGDCAIPSYRGVNDLLGRALTGNAMWFSSGEERIAKLYAPSEFKFGSSIYHLDDNLYGEQGDINSLLTPSMPSGYAQHSIGPLILRMQQLMLNESEFGAPLCNGSEVPVSKEPVKRRNKNDSSTTGPDASSCVKVGGSCLSMGVIIGIAVGALVGVAVIGVVLYFLLCAGRS